MVGRADVMHTFEEIFFSFTFAGEVASMAAAMKVLDILEHTDALARMESNGRTLQDGVNAHGEGGWTWDSGFDAVGRPQWSLLKFFDQNGADSPLLKNLFQQEAVKRGVLFLATHNMTAAHDTAAIHQTLEAYAEVMKTLADVGRGFQSRALSGRAHDSASVPGAMNLLFRTDASLTMGTGHVMRCVALAQAWQDAGGRAVFAMAETTTGIQARLAAESCEVRSVSCVAGTEQDSAQTIALARELAAEWIVVDGYQFNADYQRALKAAGFKVLFLDDYGHAAHYSADLVLNQNAYADEKMYDARESYTRLLLGPSYCLLRREFTSWRGWKREIAPIGRKVLVTMGGSDPDNFTATVIEGLRSLPNIEATVVVGGSNPHIESLQRMTAAHGGRASAVEQRIEYAGIDGAGRHGRQRGGFDLLGNVFAPIADGA